MSLTGTEYGELSTTIENQVLILNLIFARIENRVSMYFWTVPYRCIIFFQPYRHWGAIGSFRINGCLYNCGKFFFSGNFYFCFVSTSLAYTLTYPKTKVIRDKKLTTTSILSGWIQRKWKGFLSARAKLVCYTAVFSVVMQRPFPQTAA